MVQLKSFNALMGLSCYVGDSTLMEMQFCFNALMGLSCYCDCIQVRCLQGCFNALMGLSCYCSVSSLRFAYLVSMPSWAWVVTELKLWFMIFPTSFNALMGLSCYWDQERSARFWWCFNALMGLSCYSKNAQYFKFPMILFYAYLLFISIYYHTCQFFSTNYLSFWGANPLVLFWELAFRTTLLSFFW